MKRIVIVVVLLGVLLVLGLGGGLVAAQGPQPPHAAQAALGTAFTYQGELTKNGAPVTTSCNLHFTLFADAGGTVTVAGPVSGSPDPVMPTNGRFTVQVDFGAAKFDGTGRWLGVAAKCAGDNVFTPMSALQPLTATPYALYSATAGSVNYQNVVVVAKSGGNYATITNALNSITTASDANRFLVKVMPGVYTETVTMKPYVDIEGSGESTTKISQVGSQYPGTGTVVGANDAELRFLTVASTGGGNAIAIYNYYASPRLNHIAATASGASSSNRGVYNNSLCSPTMTNLTASASGGTNNFGVYNLMSSPTMTNVTAKAEAAAGGYTFGVRNEASSSPTMTNVTATASGGTTNEGVYNAGSSPTMTSVRATASGGSSSYGVHNESSSPPMTSVRATASGGTTNYGVYNQGSSVTIQNSTISASGGNSYGIVNNTSGPGSYTMNINNSVVSGGTNTVYNLTAGYTVRVGASQLIGNGGQGLGTYICIFSYKANYTALNSTCQ